MIFKEGLGTMGTWGHMCCILISVIRICYKKNLNRMYRLGSSGLLKESERIKLCEEIKTVPILRGFNALSLVQRVCQLTFLASDWLGQKLLHSDWLLTQPRTVTVSGISLRLFILHTFSRSWLKSVHFVVEWQYCTTLIYWLFVWLWYNLAIHGFLRVDLKIQFS